jgi:hypothetical protein
MPRYALLNSQDSLADLMAAIFDDRGLPIRMRSPQLFDQASSEPKFGQGSLKSVFVLELFALLRREISFKKNVARIVLLRRKRNYQKKEKQGGKKRRANSPHATTSRGDNQAAGRFSFHRRRQLVEWPGKVESFVCKKGLEF